MTTVKLKRFIWRCGLTTLVGLCFFFPVPIWGITVGVTPTRLELTGLPGQILNEYFDVSGEERSNSRISSYLGDWDLDLEGHVRFLNDGENPRSASKWVKVEPSEFPVDAGSKRRVRVTIRIPADAEGGEYWTMAFFEARSASALKKTGVNMAGRIGNAIYVVVNKNILRKAAITAMSCFWSAEKGFQAVLRFENKGNVRLLPRGRIEIRNTEGRTVETVPVEEQQVLPGYSRLLTAKKNMDLKPGLYIVLAVLDYDGEKLVAAQTAMKVIK